MISLINLRILLSFGPGDPARGDYFRFADGFPKCNSFQSNREIWINFKQSVYLANTNYSQNCGARVEIYHLIYSKIWAVWKVC